MRRLPPWAVLAALVAASAGLRFWAASAVPAPWIAPDELIYAALGRSLWSGAGFEILGAPSRFYSLVVPAVVGLPLRLRDVALGYTLLKLLQAVVMSLAAIPAYLWARRLAGSGWALAAAALTLALPGLAYSGLVMTEVEFYPVATLAALALAGAVARPTVRNQALAVAAVVLAAATRLQAAVLLPAFATAVVLDAAFRRDLRRVLRFWPSAAAAVAVAAAWAAYRLASGGPVTELLGAYRAAGETSYGAGDVLLFVRWHAADALLLCGVAPACAAALLVWRAAAGRERDDDALAYAAVATALCGWLVAEVGVFASRHVGRLAERDLLALAPVLFVGLVAWLARGAPRPRAATAVVAALALALVLSLPLGRLVSLQAIPDAFTLIPLQRLQVRAPSVSVRLVGDLAAAAAVAGFVLVPRRARWALPLALGLALAAISLSVGRVVAAQARIARTETLGDTRQWIDRAAQGPVTYLYSGEVFWNSVWESAFWNRRVDRVYDLLTAQVPGPMPQASVGPEEDGRLVLADGSPARGPYVVASTALSFAGRRVAEAPPAGLALWRAVPPLRLRAWRQLRLSPDGGLVERAKLLVYACRGGTARLALVSPVAQTVTVRLNERPWRRVGVGAGRSWSISTPLAPPRGHALCSIAVEPSGAGVTLSRLSYVRRAQ